MGTDSHSIYGGRYFAHSLKRNISRKIGRLKYHQLIEKQKDTRILVILHLFYMDAWKEVCEYLKNLSPYNYSLIVTCMEGYYDEKTLNSVKTFNPQATIIKCENLGWDLLPFLIAIRSVKLTDYDIIFKLQTKGTKRKETFLYGQYFRYRDWFLNLFEGCIGAFTVHTTIRDLINRKKNIGLVAARNLIVEDPIHKRHMVEETIKELKLPYIKEYKFVAGTCFAVRANLLNTIQKLDIDKNKFNTKGFSYAHRLERIICLPPQWEGLKMHGPKVLRFRRNLWFLHPFAWWWRKYNGARVLNDPQVHVDNVFAFNCIEPRLIKSWELLNIKVGDIKRALYPGDKGIISLKETLPYKYLETRNPDVYEEYCKYNREVWNTDIMSQKRFDELISSMEDKGYVEENNIVTDDKNIIWDGQHRCCRLHYKKGPDYPVKVLRLKRYYPQPPLLFRISNSLKYRIPLVLNFLFSYTNKKK